MMTGTIPYSVLSDWYPIAHDVTDTNHESKCKESPAKSDTGISQGPPGRPVLLESFTHIDLSILHYAMHIAYA